MSVELVIAIGGWVFNVVTAGIAYKAGTRVHSETTRDNDKDIFVASVTNERAKWREDLRKNVAEFMKQCVMASPEIPELVRLKTDIILRLNPRARQADMAEKHKYDRQIMQAINALFGEVLAGPIQPLNPRLMALEEATQELLKQEWQKSKDEASTGRERNKSRSDAIAEKA